MADPFPTASLYDGDVHVLTGTYRALAAEIGFHHFPERLRVEGKSRPFTMTGAEFVRALRETGRDC